MGDIIFTFLKEKAFKPLKCVLEAVGNYMGCNLMVTMSSLKSSLFESEKNEITNHNNIFQNMIAVAQLFLKDLDRHEYKLNHRGNTKSNLGDYIYTNNYYNKKLCEKEDNTVKDVVQHAEIQKKIIASTKHIFKTTNINALIGTNKKINELTKSLIEEKISPDVESTEVKTKSIVNESLETPSLISTDESENGDESDIAHNVLREEEEKEIETPFQEIPKTFLSEHIRSLETITENTVDTTPKETIAEVDKSNVHLQPILSLSGQEIPQLNISLKEVIEILRGKNLIMNRDLGAFEFISDFTNYQERVHIFFILDDAFTNTFDSLEVIGFSLTFARRIRFDQKKKILFISVNDSYNVSTFLSEVLLNINRHFNPTGLLLVLVAPYKTIINYNNVTIKMIQTFNNNTFGLFLCMDNATQIKAINEIINNQLIDTNYGSLYDELEKNKAISAYLTKIETQYLPSNHPDSKYINPRLEVKAKLFITEAVITNNHRDIWRRHLDGKVGKVADEEKYRFIKADEADLYDYEYAFNGVSMVKRKDGVFPTIKSKVVLVSRESKVMNSTTMYNNIDKLGAEQLHYCEYMFINGLAGCGKSYNIIKKFSPKNDLILTSTKSNAQDLRDKVKKNYKQKISDLNLKIRTIDSLLCDSVTEYIGVHTLFVDEVFMVHSGYILWAAQRVKPKYVVAMGDVRQIPYIERLLQSVRYSDITNFAYCVDQLGISLRCPLDVAAVFDSTYRPRKDDQIMVNTGFLTTNNKEKTMFFSFDISMTTIKEYLRSLGDDVIFLTFKEAEAEELRKNGVDKALTIHQQQGVTSKYVVIWRKSAKPNDDIYKSDEHILVALTRHTVACYYHSPINDKMSRIIDSAKAISINKKREHLVDHKKVRPFTLPDSMEPKKDLLNIISRKSNFISKKKRGGDDNYDYTLTEIFSDDLKTARARFEYKRITTPFSLNKADVFNLLSNGGNNKGFTNPFLVKKNFKNTNQENKNIKEMMLFNGYTDGLSEDIEELYNSEDLRLSKYTPAFRGNYGSPSVCILQDFFDTLVPNASYIDYNFDPKIVESSNLELFCDPLQFNPVMKLPAKQLYDKLTPILRTHMPATRPNSQVETLLAVIKRNLNVPKLQSTIDHNNMVKILVTNFVDTYIPKQNMMVLSGYYIDKIEPNISHVNSWLESQVSKLDRNVDPEFNLNTADLSYYNCMIKPTPKPVLDTTGINTYSALQTICYHNKDINTIFCSTFKILKKRILSVLDHRFKIFTDISPESFSEQLSNEFDASILDFANKLEIDISKYDKSQGKLLLDVEIEIYRLFGLPEELLMRWYEAHKDTTLHDRVNKLKFFVKYQRKSGNASTYLGNTLVLMVVLATLFNLRDALLVLFSGDDSLIVHKERLADRNSECANLFNLESKFFRYKYPYFCSKFLLNINGKFRMIPDPLKVLIKFGRTDLVNYEHMEDYRVSACDLLSVYNDMNIDQYLSAAMDERYGKTHKLIDYSELLHSILAFIHTRENFSRLFTIDDNASINLDPSRPNLD